MAYIYCGRICGNLFFINFHMGGVGAREVVERLRSLFHSFLPTPYIHKGYIMSDFKTGFAISITFVAALFLMLAIDPQVEIITSMQYVGLLGSMTSLRKRVLTKGFSQEDYMELCKELGVGWQDHLFSKELDACKHIGTQQEVWVTEHDGVLIVCFDCNDEIISKHRVTDSDRDSQGNLVFVAETWLYPEHDCVQVIVKKEHGKFYVFREAYKLILVEDGYMMYEDVESDIDLYDVYDTEEEAEDVAHWYFITTVNC